MKHRRSIYPLAILMAVVMTAGCAATRQQAPFKPVDLNPLIRSGAMTASVGGFLIVLDASASMNQRHRGMAKIHQAVKFIDELNRTLPDLYVTAGMRVFGGNTSPLENVSQLVFGMADYNREALAAAIKAIDGAGGNGPMDLAVTDAADDLAQIAGVRLAAILVSDGSAPASGTIEATRRIKERFGDRLCIYTVLVGQSQDGKSLMEWIADIGGCGVAVSADAVDTPRAMADFVSTVFLTKNEAPLDTDGDGVIDPFDQCPDTPSHAAVDDRGCLADSDGDGTVDIIDNCPGTPAGYAVDDNGCPPDTDGDIVWDVLDKCPGTPKGIAVDNVGCPLDSDRDTVADYLDQCPGTPVGAHADSRGCWVLEGVQFASGRWDINAAAAAQLDAVAAVLKDNPKVVVEIQGYTDNTGSKAVNQQLSERRARAVADYIAARGVPANRLRARGLGQSRPIAANDTPERRAMNRRVEITPID